MTAWDLEKREETTTRPPPEPTGEAREAEQKKVRLVQKRFMAYRSSQETWATEAAKNVDLFHNIPFTPEQTAAIKARGLAPVGIPHLHRVVRQHVSMLAANTPTFQAFGREDSDPALAKVYSDLFSYVWSDQVSKGNRHLRRVIEDDVIVGRGVFFAWADPRADYGRGEVFVGSLNPLEVYPDPNSREKDWSDAADIVTSRLVTRERARATWPHLKDRVDRAKAAADTSDNHSTRTGEEGQQRTGDVQDGLHDKLRLTERYAKILQPFHLVEEGEAPQTREQLLTPAAYAAFRQGQAFAVRGEAGDTFVTAPEEVAFFAQLYRQAGGDGSAPATAFVPQQDPATGAPVPVPVVLVPLTKGDLVDIGVIPHRETREIRVQVTCVLGDVLLYEYVLPTEHYPLVPYNSEHDRTPYPTSDATKVRPMIEEYNKKQQIILAHAASIAGTKYWAQEGTVDHSVEEKLARPGADVLFHRGEQAPTPNNPPQLPGEFYANQDRLTALIDDTLGHYPFQQGDPTNSPETVRGTLFIDEASQRRVKIKSDDLYETLNQLARVVMDLARATYTRRKVIRIIEPSGPRTVAINDPVRDASGRVVDLLYDVTAARYDVVVVSGSTLPVSRWAQAEYLAQAIERLGPYGQALIPDYIRKLEIPNADEVIQRADVIMQQQQQMAAQEEEIKRLKGDLQTAQRETLNALRKAAMADFEADLAEPRERVRKEAELTTQRLQDGLRADQALLAQIDAL